MAMNEGVPLRLLKEFLGQKITIEANCGDIYKGELIGTEENMSVSLNKVKATLIDGRTAKMRSVYIRGSRIRLISLPEAAAKDAFRNLTPPSSRRCGRGGGFRGGRGGGSGRRHGGKPSYDRHRY